MSKWLKRIRGAVGMGVTWALAWSFVCAVGALQGLVFGALNGGAVYFVNSVLWFALAGLIGGSAFSVVLGIAGRRHTFDDLSLPRFAGWGALSALLMFVPTAALLGVQLLTPEALVTTALVVGLGAGSAAGSLALARRADDSELLDAGADVAEVGLTKEETRQLLGR